MEGAHAYFKRLPHTLSNMDSSSLNDQFGVDGVVWFENIGDLCCVQIATTDLCHNSYKSGAGRTAETRATVFLQGAHITHWRPAGQEEVLFLSRTAELLPGKAIRGGVPISFPWFATDKNECRIDGKPGPSHGFARIQPWEVGFVAVSGGDVHLTLTLGSTQLSRDLGFDRFHLIYEITVGQSLSLQLTVANDGDTPLTFEEAFHTYFAVSNVRKISVDGLELSPFIDKVQGDGKVDAEHKPLTITGATDRVYPDTSKTCVLRDPARGRAIVNSKAHSSTTVVFNPGKSLSDLGADQWPEMLCIETANTGENRITLGSREVHVMQAKIRVEAHPNQKGEEA